MMEPTDRSRAWRKNETLTTTFRPSHIYIALLCLSAFCLILVLAVEVEVAKRHVMRLDSYATYTLRQEAGSPDLSQSQQAQEGKALDHKLHPGGNEAAGNKPQLQKANKAMRKGKKQQQPTPAPALSPSTIKSSINGSQPLNSEETLAKAQTKVPANSKHPKDTSRTSAGEVGSPPKNSSAGANTGSVVPSPPSKNGQPAAKDTPDNQAVKPQIQEGEKGRANKKGRNPKKGQSVGVAPGVNNATVARGDSPGMNNKEPQESVEKSLAIQESEKGQVGKNKKSGFPQRKGGKPEVQAEGQKKLEAQVQGKKKKVPTATLR